ncbi:carboxylate-amine ligase [Labrys monachus]|uniref:Putative glutamate--cysteine ligase 2 n=1 Tax=Labrys monachus TaxID=217067 RepID=A0ABU0FES7_9HYPH|nr:carboxylate-amine ligase [Labrys monachus]MDQ0393117.1 carboxylate-amine ligase [Labrys monachus]
MGGDYTFGIEEEYFVFERRSGKAGESVPPGFFEAARQALGKSVSHELLQSQIEVATSPSSAVADARGQLLHFRRTLQALAGEHGLGILAAGTHPSAEWSEQRPTELPRYDKVAQDLQILARRQMICGMHVHVEIPSGLSRVALMNRTLPYLPLFLALSASSPFWQSRRTGLMAYRQAVYAALPRSGLPDLFADEQDYASYVAALVGNRIIADASFLWWDLRPSLRFPTMELRIADACTRVEDALAIAMLYRCLVRHLCRHPELNRDMTAAGRAIVEENKWRAERYGIHGSLIDLASGEAQPVPELVGALRALVREDSRVLECEAALAGIDVILQRGTSADCQLAVYGEQLSQGKPPATAIAALVEWLAGATVEAIGPASTAPA